MDLAIIKFGIALVAKGKSSSFLFFHPLATDLCLFPCDVSIARLFKETFRGRDKDTFSGQCIRLTHIADGDLSASVCLAPVPRQMGALH